MSAALRRILVLAVEKSSPLRRKEEIGLKLSRLYEIVHVVESKKSGEPQETCTYMRYSARPIGILRGMMPDAFILSHQPTRVKDDFGNQLPSLSDSLRLHEEVIRHFKPSSVVNAGVYTFRLGSDKLADVMLRTFTQEMAVSVTATVNI